MRICGGLILLLIVLGWMVPRVVFAGDVVLGCKRTGPLVVDGVFNESVWQQATWNTAFTTLGKDTLHGPDTEFAVAYDENAIYIGIKINEPDMLQLVSKPRGRDDIDIFKDDCVEVFIGPGSQRIWYNQLVVNPDGTLVDYELDQSGVVSRIDWDSLAQVATNRTDQAWLVELAIPLAAFEIEPDFDGSWSINVTRERRAGTGPRLSSFVELAGSFQQPDKFATLKIDGIDFKRYCWDIGSIGEMKIQKNKNQLDLKTKVTIKNNTGKLAPVLIKPILQYQGKPYIGKVIRDFLDVGQSKTYPIECLLPGEGKQVLRIDLEDPRLSTKQLYAGKSFSVKPVYSPLTLILHSPGYRDDIYPTQQIQTIVGVIQCALSEEQLSDMSVVVTLSGEDDNNQPLVQEIIKAPAEQNHFGLPLPELKTGTYALRVQLKNNVGDVRTELIRRIRKLAAPASGIAWRIDNGILLRNGEPFFPSGWFSMNTNEIRESGGIYNVTQRYNTPYMATEQVASWLNDVAEVGGGAFIYPYPNGHTLTNVTELLSEQEANQIRDRVIALKDNPDRHHYQPSKDQQKG